MGIYDRDYYRGDADSSAPGMMRAVSNMSMTNKLVVANVVVYILCWLVGNSNPQLNKEIYEKLSIDSSFFTVESAADESSEPADDAVVDTPATEEAAPAPHPWEIWRLITAGFMHAGPHTNIGVMHIAFNMFGLWMFGRFVEQRYGAKEFLRFYLLAIIVSSLIFAASYYFLEVPEGLLVVRAVGASGGVVAVVILYCFLYPKTKLLMMMIIPVDAWVAGLMYVGYDIYLAVRSSTGEPTGIAWQAHLGGAAFAALYFKLGWKFSGQGRTKRKPKTKLKIHKPVRDELSADEQLIARGEKILEQVHQRGESSLSARQRQTLQRYSELMQQRQR
ncbi:MAG TPA: rhomboid family intramembrane serine protease [Planctomycetes bacterium]|nr:rhomboid family intramembrane serine protease [Planctomycetaceae bacterium]HIN53087.1 rhomboid family intramembrane serine protease [Planctomycetota bacterium]